EGDDSSVRMDGARLEFGDVKIVVVVRDLHVGVFLAFVGENLDAVVAGAIVLVVVAEVLVIEHHGSGVRRLGLRRHLEFFRRNWLPAIKGRGQRSQAEEDTKKGKESP